jgi:hypothetical protein
MTDFETLRKRFRNGCGFLLAAVWIVWWWHVISVNEASELAKMAPAKGILSGGYNYIHSNTIGWGSAMERLLAIISSPLMFIPAQYLSHLLVGYLQRAERANDLAAQKARREDQQRSLTHMRDSAASEAALTQRANDRHELVSRIGDIDSQLLVFEGEQGGERSTRMLLNLTSMVYEIHAKFPAERLGAMTADDPSLRKMIGNTLSHMQRLGLDGHNFYAVMSEFVPDARLPVNAAGTISPAGVSAPRPAGSSAR